MASRVYGRYPHHLTEPHCWRRTNKESLATTQRSRPPFETQEVQIWSVRDWLFGFNSQTRLYCHGSNKTCGNCRLADTLLCEGSLIIFRFHQLLSPLHLQLFFNRMPADRSYQKEQSVALVLLMSRNLWTFEETVSSGTRPCSPQFIQTIRYCHRCFFSSIRRNSPSNRV